MGRSEEGPEGGSTQADKEAAAEAAIEALRTGAAREATLPEALRHLPERERAQELDLNRSFAEQEHALRERYATWILIILAGQFLIADAVFVAYAWAGHGWAIPASVMHWWLATMVVQIVGVAHVVTRHLFPNRDGPSTGPKGSP